MPRVVATVRNGAGLAATMPSDFLFLLPPAPPPDIGYMTPAATAELPLLASGAKPYPPPWIWDGAKTTAQPRAATAADNLPPRIEQWRDGALLATYRSFGTDWAVGAKAWPAASAAFPSSSPAYIAQAAALGAGPFGDSTGSDFWRLWREGDEFRVFPAVYTGRANNLLIMSKYDYWKDAQAPHFPRNLTIRGVTVNGIRPVIYCDTNNVVDFASGQGPVYLWNTENITIENIDVVKGPNSAIGKAGIYLRSTTNTTLRQMRVSGFGDHSATLYGQNGVFGTDDNKGVLLLDQVELADNGGSDGPAHNAYIGGGADPSFTLHAVNCWSHGATFGHLFKSRAPINIFDGCYFEGGLPRAWPVKGGTTTVQPADNWMLDVPNGGDLTVRNCVFLKQRSGAGSNGAAITWGVEGIVDGRKRAIDIQHNTFVTLSATYDGGRPTWPMFFRQLRWPIGAALSYPEMAVPVPVTIARNVFVGYTPRLSTGQNAFMNYRGEHPVTAAFAELSQDFSLAVKTAPGDDDAGDAIVGTPAYSHEAQPGAMRSVASIGAVD